MKYKVRITGTNGYQTAWVIMEANSIALAICQLQLICGKLTKEVFTQVEAELITKEEY